MILLGLDWGKQRTGVAISDSSWTMASPLDVIDTHSPWNRLEKIVRDYQAERIVMGYPLSLSTGEVNREWGGFRFFEKVKPRLMLPVSWVDETFTTHESYERLSVEGIRFKQKREAVDKIAASLILERFMEERRSRKNTIVAVTGNLGSGKSYVSGRMAEKCGGSLLSADTVSRRVTAPGGEGARLIEQLFGREFFTPAGELDRKKLGEVVFTQPVMLKRLNRALHPLIRKALLEEMEMRKGEIIFLEVPLLAENRLYYLYDFSLLTKSAADVIIARVKERDRRSDREISHILKQQAPPHDVESLFDCAVDTSHGWESYREEVDKFLKEVISYHREIMFKGK